MTTAISYKVKNLFGNPTVPGDKSMTHRALILGALAVGKTTIENGLESDDTRATRSILQQLGVRIVRYENVGQPYLEINGVGVGGLTQPSQVLDCGNSGTTARLMSGVLAAHSGTFFMTGDGSLCRRPMERVMTPLKLMGARFLSSPGNHLPMAIIGTDQIIPIIYHLPVASAQIKSALLLAGLNSPGATQIIETHATRDHTERLMHWLGMPIEQGQAKNNTYVTIKGQQDFKARPIKVPSDPSAAAFLVVAAILVSQSRIVLDEIMLNPYRTRYLDILQQMGARMTIEETGEVSGHNVGTIIAETAELKAVEVEADLVPSLIDEYPILAIAAACAKGTTIFRGVSELRQKESDRLAGIVNGLRSVGIKASFQQDDLIIEGQPGPISGGCTIDACHDHRLAMAFLVLGMRTETGIKVDNADMITTSFPAFFTVINELGGQLTYDQR